jgi:hypothetical protein
MQDSELSKLDFIQTSPKVHVKLGRNANRS